MKTKLTEKVHNIKALAKHAVGKALKYQQLEGEATEKKDYTTKDPFQNMQR